jgi:D-alanyl-D-alanine dipeptidase
VPDASRQLVLVRTKSWNSQTGILQRYERGEQGKWRAIGEPTPINVGRSGMAWGRGLHDVHADGPVKREGDGRAPAGVYALGSAFGYAGELPKGNNHFDYLPLRNGMYCVEDVHSPHYNQIVDGAAVGLKAWERRSVMRRPDGLFRWGVVVRQNDTETVKGAGSCIFLHIWRGLRRGTAGCTALPEEQVEKLLSWLDSAKTPVLVQLPLVEYERLQSSWGLPDEAPALP